MERFHHITFWRERKGSGVTENGMTEMYGYFAKIMEKLPKTGRFKAENPNDNEKSNRKVLKSD